MTTIKSFTSLEQSLKLAEILPLESADMYYHYIVGVDSYHEKVPKVIQVFNHFVFFHSDIPCWSLAALLNYLREIDFFPNIEANECSVTMNINYYNEEEARPLATVHNIKVEAESFIDACYEMILKLHTKKLL